MTESVITAITDVFTAIFAWIMEAVQTVVGVFWASEGGLTFLGVLALIALGISVFFLVMGLIQNFLHFRG